MQVSPSDERLGELVERWKEMRQSGRASSVRELCVECPELADRLEERLAVLREPDGDFEVTATPTASIA
jgi:hypothetical protein